MKIRQLAAILLSIIMLFTLLTSCELQPTAEELLLIASANMLANPYEMTIDISMSSDNKEVNDIMSMVNGTYSARVDGDNLEMTMAVAGVEVDYLLVDDVIYMNMYGLKVKMPVNTEQTDELFGEIIGSFDGSVDGLGKLKDATMTSENGLTTITINGAGALVNEAIEKFGDTLGDDVVITANEEKTSIVIVLDEDNFYKSMTMNMALEYSVEGLDEKVSVDLKYDYTFDFSEDFEIVAPDDADSYVSMDYDDIYGK